MEAAAIIAAINGAVQLIAALTPLIEQARLKGEISVEQQAELKAAFDSLRSAAGGQFSGPEWQAD